MEHNKKDLGMVKKIYGIEIVRNRKRVSLWLS